MGQHCKGCKSLARAIKPEREREIYVSKGYVPEMTENKVMKS
jgi:hypothetical protein